MTALLCFILGTSYLCHVVAHAKVNERLQRALRIIALLGAALAAIGYFAEGLSISFDNQVWSTIWHALATGSPYSGLEFLGGGL
jgi:hypothetical protein